MAGGIETMPDGIIRREGGFVDHPADRGGPTKYGITLATLAAWRGRPVTREDVRDLTVAEARAIYVDRIQAEGPVVQIHRPHGSTGMVHKERLAMQKSLLVAIDLDSGIEQRGHEGVSGKIGRRRRTGGPIKKRALSSSTTLLSAPYRGR